MIPLGGLLFRGATLTERDDLAPGTGRLGRPVWNRPALLADLELRLGIPSAPVEHGVRLQRWSQRLAALSRGRERFYSRSYAIDPIGTATTLLGWRDQLVDAGWNGEPIPGGGERLETFCELERDLDLPPGLADRLRRVETALATSTITPWSGLELAESTAAWPERWRRVFALLEARGVPVRTIEAPLSGNAESGSDLGRLQASIRGEAIEPGFRGDGSLVLLTGETSWELAHAVAALLARLKEPSTRASSSVVVRGGDVSALDTAFAEQGLAGQGLDSESRWRPPLQLLPLALELVYLPRDPYRVLELVTLPLGPFEGWVGLQLARAISSSPGIGGRDWNEAKRRIAEVTKKPEEDEIPGPTEGRRDRLAEIAEWLEGPGFEEPGAPRAHLLEVVSRVQRHLHSRFVRARLAAQEEGERSKGTTPHDELMLGAAYSQAQAFHTALSHDGREHLDLVAVRQLLEEVSLGAVSLPLGEEEAGRIDFVDSPAGLRARRDTVVWWHCVDGTQETSSLDPWRIAERAALEAAGMRLPDRGALLAAEVESWRRVVLSADRRLILVVPAAAHGSRLDPHPIWDELVSRARASSADVARVALSSDELLTREPSVAKELDVRVRTLEPLALPPPRVSWRVTTPLFRDGASYSATSLERIVSCPLSWVFAHRAGLRASWALEIASGPLLNGRLGHRLIEELHTAGSFRDGATDEVARVLERLIDEEGAVLRRPGMTFELAQLRQQLVDAVQRLARLLDESGLSIAEVESSTSVDWGGRRLEGRLDLLLHDAEGNEVVLDLKWGRKTYVDKLKAGLALQLAAYSAARKIQGGKATLPHAAYFSLSGGSLLTTEKGHFQGTRPIEGPTLAETWKKVERTVVAVERLLQKGTVAATGLSSSPSLLESAEIPETCHGEHVMDPTPCKYCRHGTLCGKAWEGFS
jgi:ATP-dependent helicase/nuclease subunit B